MTLDALSMSPLQEAVTHPLQQILAPREPEDPATLYFAAGSADVRGDGSFRLQAGDYLIADSYFNSLYLSWWRLHSNVRRIGLQCQSSGPLTLLIVGHRADGTRMDLGTWNVTEADSAIFWVWDRTVSAGVTRLHVEVIAVAEVTLHSLSFVTDERPLQDVSLSIGLCTFNREESIAATMAGLLDLQQSEPALRRIILVNQGGVFRHEDLCALRNRPGVRVIRQPNLGGSGGFARTIVATMEAAEPVTHHLLMDDDIRLDPRVLSRALRFLEHATDTIAVGGQSIEMEDRQRLHEAGAMVRPDWLFAAIGEGLPLDDSRSLKLWDRPFVPDYVGWWFCILPVAAIRKIGLPAPFFLHSDDVEYGLRLKAAGVPLLPLPGLGVWHSSVRFKHVGVMRYYDLRNMLILAATQSKGQPRPGALFVLGWIMHNLLAHRYRAAMACLIAIEDYLAGPDRALGPSLESRNRAVRDRVHALPAPPLCEEGIGIHTLAPPAQPQGGTILGQVLKFVCVFLRILLLPQPDRKNLLVHGIPQPHAIGGRSYRLALDADSQRCLVMRPNRWRLVWMTGRALVLSARYALTESKAASRWENEMPDLRSHARWMAAFGTSDD